ncbi:exported hypothetical protein [Candidatus Sulfopaludibacter sp. SbA3]|nr:exported hypothetical protein [Candidatus Sulfopaludibacter sp. SbA3]
MTRAAWSAFAVSMAWAQPQAENESRLRDEAARRFGELTERAPDCKIGVVMNGRPVSVATIGAQTDRAGGAMRASLVKSAR